MANHIGIYARPLLNKLFAGMPARVRKKIAPPKPAQAVASNPFTRMVLNPAVDGANRVTIYGMADYTLRIEYTENLSNPDWQTLTSGRIDENGSFEFMDKTAVETRFYRVAPY
ncbi:MAG TPA: hypothetical protein VGE41_07495 [Verrucomicrobiae bacterium]